MSSCDRCHKGNLHGNQIARARQGLNYRSSRLFRPNLHVFRALVNGRKVRMRLCTKCLRIVKKEQAELVKALQEARLKIQANQVKHKIVKRAKKPIAKLPTKTREEKKAAKATREAEKLARLKAKEEVKTAKKASAAKK